MVSTGLSSTLLKEIVDRIVEHCDANRIYLYGSRARGDFERTSDIDIAVECHDSSGLFAEALKDEIRTLLEMDIVDFNKISHRLRDEILSEGIVIYEKIELLSDEFKKALKALEVGVETTHSELEMDGVVPRLEFTFELFWKLLKVYLEREGILINSPKRALQEAYKIRIIQEEDAALTMLDDRNLTSHTYDESVAKEIHDRIAGQYLKLFKGALAKMVL